MQASSGRRRFLGSALGLPVMVTAAATATAARLAHAQRLTSARAGIPPEQTPPANLGQRLLQGYIQPALRQFHDSAYWLHRELMEDPVRWAPKRAAEAFSNLMRAWPAVSLLRFGPLVQDNRFERLFFWPDPRGVMSRQMRPLLQAVDAVPKDLHTHSVAVQGLPALVAAVDMMPWNGGERDDRSAAREVYVRALARNILAIAADLKQAWAQMQTQTQTQTQDSYARDFAHPASTNAVYRNDKEVLMEVVKALSAGLRFVGDMQLRAALGKQQTQARVQVLPFGRNGALAYTHMFESVRALAQWHRVAAFEREPAWLRQNLQAELQGSADLLQTPDGMHLPNMAQNEAVYQTLSLVVLKLDNARRMVDENLAPALGVGLGFNALDGD